MMSDLMGQVTGPYNTCISSFPRSSSSHIIHLYPSFFISSSSPLSSILYILKFSSYLLSLHLSFLPFSSFFFQLQSYLATPLFFISFFFLLSSRLAQSFTFTSPCFLSLFFRHLFVPSLFAALSPYL